MAASPGRTPQLSITQEFSALQRALTGQAAQFELRPLFDATAELLHEQLIRYEPDVVHLVAHGLPDGVQLDHEAWAELLPAQLLDVLLRSQTQLRCVVLNACYSASWFRQSLGPALVVMNGQVDDRAAVAFSKGFYSALAAGKTLALAFEAGKHRASLGAFAGPLEPSFLPDCRGVIGLRTREHFHPAAKERCLFFHDLSAALGEEASPSWDGAADELRGFLQSPKLTRSLERGGDHLIHLDCGFSITLLAGRLLGPQVPVYPMWRAGPRRALWKPERSVPPPREPLWQAKVVTPQTPTTRLAISVSVSISVQAAVDRELAGWAQPVQCIEFQPVGGANQQSVQSPDHAYALACELAHRIQRAQAEARVEVIDLFIAAPNGLVFFLGQQGASLGRVQMYEFDKVTRRYSPSLLIE